MPLHQQLQLLGMMTVVPAAVASRGRVGSRRLLGIETSVEVFNARHERVLDALNDVHGEIRLQRTEYRRNNYHNKESLKLLQ